MDPPARGRRLTLGLACWLLAPRTATAAPPACEQVACAPLSGIVRAAGERSVVAGARVFVLPAEPDESIGRVTGPRVDDDEPAWFRSAQSDEDGRFSVDDVPAGRVRVAVLHERFGRQEWVIDAPDRSARGLTLYLRPRGADPYRTVVEDAPPAIEVPAPAEYGLSREEVDTVPGSHGDVIRSLQNMPGVARTAGGFGELVLRGAGPGQTQVYAGSLRIPRAFHFPGIASVLSSGTVDSVELVPGNYDVAYGNGTGGLVRIVPRRGRSDGHHGYAELDLGGVGGIAEGPIGRRGWTYLTGVQRSHVDLIVRGVRRIDPNADIAEPQYYDYQAFFDRRRGGRELGFHVLGSWDRLVTRDLFSDAAPAFDFRAGFHRIDMTARRRISDWVFSFSPGFRFDSGQAHFAASEYEAGRRDYVTTVRAQIQRTIGRGHVVRVGTETELDAYAWRQSFPTYDLERGEYQYSEQDHGLETAIAVYASTTLKLRTLTLTPGVRQTVFTLGPTVRSATDPRVVATWTPAPRVRWMAGVGMYSGVFQRGSGLGPQLVDWLHATPDGGGVLVPASIRSVFNRAIRLETTDLRLARALQVSNGLAIDLPGDLALEVTGFLRRRASHLPPLDNNGSVRASWLNWGYGLETLLRRQLSKGLYGWIGYTLMWTRDVRPEQLGYARRVENGDYDQRHNLVAVASYALPRNWRIGLRFRYATGLPYTPVVGGWSSTQYGTTTFHPVFGPPQSARYPAMHQLDLRIDKRLYGRYASVLLYLDVQNVYNRANTDVYIYSPDFSQKIGSIGLPIFPTIGVRVEF